jgi:hypothetical protein
MTTLSKRHLRLIEGGRKDSPDPVLLAFAPCWFWLAMWAAMIGRPK